MAETSHAPTVVDPPARRPHHGPEHGPAASLHARRSAPGAGNRRRDQSSASIPTSATCTPASKKPARPSSTSRLFRSPTASTTSSPMANNLCYCLAVEKLLRSGNPRAGAVDARPAHRAHAASIRTWSGWARTPWTLARSPSSSTPSANAKRSCASSKHVAGQRMMTSYFRIGGLAHGAAAGFLRPRAALHQRRFPEKIDEYSNLLTGNPIFMQSPEGRRLSALQPMPLRWALPGRRCAPRGVDYRPAPRHAVLQLREVPVQGADLDGRRHLGAIRSPPRSRCARASRSSSRRWTACPRAPSKPTRPRSFCPTAKR